MERSANNDAVQRGKSIQKVGSEKGTELRTGGENNIHLPSLRLV